MSATKLVPKLSFKIVCGSPEVELVTVTDLKGVTKQALRGVKKTYMRIAGVAKKYRIIDTNFGESFEFSGEFEAINLITGETFTGGKAFLPSVAASYVESAIDAAEGKIVEFVIDIGIIPDENTVGYLYEITPIHKVASTSRLQELLAEAAATTAGAGAGADATATDSDSDSVSDSVSDSNKSTKAK